MNKMFQALIEGADNGYGGDNSPERFQRQLRFLALNGKFERPPVTFPIATGLSPYPVAKPNLTSCRSRSGRCCWRYPNRRD